MIATDHTVLGGPDVLRAIIDGAKNEAIIADPWNSFDQNAVFASLSELPALSGAQR